MDLRESLRRLRFGTDLPYRVFDRLNLLLRQLGRGYRLRLSGDEARPAPFFIVGSGRSGNTLLRAILAGHGDLAIPPESYVLGPVVRDYRTLSFLPWTTLLRLVLARFHFHPQFDAWETNLGRVQRTLASSPDEERSLARILDAVYRAWIRRHMPGADRWGDKTPTNVYHLPRIAAVFPDASYIHMLRDGRDVVASYLDAGLYDSTDAACERWLESVDLVRRFAASLSSDRFREVRYERLVTEPEAVTRGVCQVLGVAFEPVMLKHRQRVNGLGDTDAEHHSGLNRPISSRSVGSWRDRLDDRQRRIVHDRLSPRLRDLGYLD